MPMPVPNNFLSLRDVLLAKLEDLHPLLAEIERQQSMESCARRDGYQDLKLNEEGDYFDAATDKLIPEEQWRRYLKESALHMHIGHWAQSMSNMAAIRLYNEELSPLERVERYVQGLAHKIEDLSLIEKVDSVSLEPMHAIIEHQRRLCEAFLEKQQASQKDRGRGASLL